MFLRARLDAFMEIFNSPKPNYDAFWAELSVDWNAAFPEFKTLFPEVETEEMLSPQQRALLGSVIKRRLKVQPIHCCKV